MKKVGSVLGRLVFGLVVVVGIIAVGLGLFIQTDQFRTVLRDQLVQMNGLDCSSQTF